MAGRGLDGARALVLEHLTPMTGGWEIRGGISLLRTIDSVNKKALFSGPPSVESPRHQIDKYLQETI